VRRIPYQKTNPDLQGTRDFKVLTHQIRQDKAAGFPAGFVHTAALGILLDLWQWAFRHASDGDVSDLTAEHLVAMTGYPGDGDLLLAALSAAGFIENVPECPGVSRLNRWSEWGGALFVEEVRERERTRKAEQRARKAAESEPVSPQCPTDVPSMSRVLQGEREGEVKVSGTPTATSQPTAPSSKVSRLSPADFLGWWAAFGKVGSRADAQKLYCWWRQQGADRNDLLTAAIKYRRWCEETATAQKHGRTFLAKDPNRWEEWLDEDHGASGDAAGRQDRQHEAGTLRAIMFMEEERRGGSIDAGRGSTTPRGLSPAEFQPGE
jgi:hypothetical protein